MELGAEDQLTRRERLRTARELDHAAPARIRVKLAGVVVIVIALLSWLAVSWLSSAAPGGVSVPKPPPLEGATQSQQGPAEIADPARADAASGSAEGPANSGLATSGPAAPGPAAPGATGGPPGVGEGSLEAQVSSPIVVHVGGAVAEPGVVELVSGARVHEAIEAAGGMTSKAAPGGLNLAAPVQDGALIWVPTPEELKKGTGPPADAQGRAEAIGAAPGSAPELTPGGGAGSVPGTPAGALINLNTADATALQGLPGIGPALSERIISYRETNGPFGSLEELAAVSGIGPVILEDVTGLVTW